MFYRPVAAIFAAALIALVFSTLASADVPVSTQSACIAKDQVIDEIMTSAGEGTFFRKVNDAPAEKLRADMEADGLTELGKSYVIFWKEGPENTAVVIAIFDEHNCFDRIIKGPRDEVLKITKEQGA